MTNTRGSGCVWQPDKHDRFHVGQKVVCVDDEGYEHQIRKGKVYCVVDVSRLPQFLRVDHWVNDAPGGNGWAARRFRPVAERKTDISIFTEMLTPSDARQFAKSTGGAS